MSWSPQVHNTDSKPFEFTAAIHSYFEVLSVDKAKVTGLKGEELTTSRRVRVRCRHAPCRADSLTVQPRSGLTYLDKGKDPKNPETK